MFVLLLFVVMCVGQSFPHTDGTSWEVLTVHTTDLEIVDGPLTDQEAVENVTAEITSWSVLNLHQEGVDEEFFTYPYSLMIRLAYHNQISPMHGREYVMKGGQPEVTICSRPVTNKWRKWGAASTCYVFTMALIELKNSTDCPHGMCDPAWLCPLPLEKDTLTFHGEIRDANTIVHQNFEIRVTGYNTSHITPTHPDDMDLNSTFWMHHIAQGSPVILMTGFQDHTGSMYLSDDEFESSNNLQLGDLVDLDLTENLCNCDDVQGTVYEAAVLVDRMLFLTKYGVIEVQGDYEYLDGEMPLYTHGHIVHAGCYNKLSVTSQYPAQSHYIVATGACDDRGRIIAAHLNFKNADPLDIKEQLSLSNETNSTQTLCDWLLTQDGNMTGCDLVDTASTAHDQGLFYILVDVEFDNGSSVYHVIKKKPDYMGWHIQSTVSKLLPSTPASGFGLLDSTEAGTEGLYLKGVSSLPTVSGDIILWGDHIIYSPDEGVSLFKVPVELTSNTSLVASARNGLLVFLTDDRQIYVGTQGLLEVRQIYPSMAWSTVQQIYEFHSMEDKHFVSAFFDRKGTFYLIEAVNRGDQVTLQRHQLPIAEILNQMTLDTEWNLVVTREMENDESTGSSAYERCIYDDIFFRINNIQKYTRTKIFAHGPPELSTPLQVHHADTIHTYHAVVNSIDRGLLGHLSRTYADGYAGYVDRWKDQRNNREIYNRYIFQNHILQDGTQVNFDDHRAVFTASGLHMEEPPATMYLEMWSNVSIHVFLVLKGNNAADLEQAIVSVTVSDPRMLAFSTTPTYFVFNHTVIYEVQIKDRGHNRFQAPPGENLVPVSLLLTVNTQPFTCFKNINGQNTPMGDYPITTMIGCPPHQKIMFDWEAAWEGNRKAKEPPMDCWVNDPDMPCFFFGNGFFPYFRIVDDATGRYSRFTGRYTLKLVGGSEISKHDITYFDEDQMYIYSNQNSEDQGTVFGPTNLPIDDIDGWPIYDYLNNGISFFCEPASPCTNIKPRRILASPNYYFVIEFSNKDVDINNTHCDYTFRFTIHVHGLPLDAIRTALILVITTIMIISTTIFLYVLCRYNNNHVYNQMIAWINMKIQRVLGDRFRIGPKPDPDADAADDPFAALDEWRRKFMANMPQPGADDDDDDDDDESHSGHDSDDDDLPDDFEPPAYYRPRKWSAEIREEDEDAQAETNILTVHSVREEEDEPSEINVLKVHADHDYTTVEELQPFREETILEDLEEEETKHL